MKVLCTPKNCIFGPYSPYFSKTIRDIKKMLGAKFTAFFTRNHLQKTPSKSDKKRKKFLKLGRTPYNSIMVIDKRHTGGVLSLGFFYKEFNKYYV